MTTVAPPIARILLGLILYLPSPALAAEVASPMVQLDPEVERRLMDAACQGPLGVGASRIAANEYGAMVECSSHDRYGSHPLFAETDCEDRKGRWVCDPLRYGIRLGNREGANRIVLDGVTPKEAVEIVRYLDELPPYADEPIKSGQIKDIVRIWRHQGNEFRVHARFTGQILSIERICELNGCVHRITSFGLIDYCRTCPAWQAPALRFRLPVEGNSLCTQRLSRFTVLTCVTF